MDPNSQTIDVLRNDRVHKDTIVTLPFDHAQKLFKRQYAQGFNFFSLPKDSAYKLKDGNLTLIRRKDDTGKAKGEGTNPKGLTA